MAEGPSTLTFPSHHDDHRVNLQQYHDLSQQSLSLQHPNRSQQEQQQPWSLTSPLSVQIVAFTVMVSACSLLGTLGNIPVLLVYRAKTRRRASNTFIKVLAVIDLLVCSVIMPYSVIFELHLVKSDLVCRLFELLRHMSVCASNLTLVAVAVERYVAVCLISRRLTVQHVNKGLFVVVVVSIVTAVPSMGLFASVTSEEVKNVTCVFPHDFQPNASFCHFTTTVLGPGLTRAYQTALVVIFFLTFLAIVVLYAIVYASLWKHAKRRAVMQSFRIEVDSVSAGEKVTSVTAATADKASTPMTSSPLPLEAGEEGEEEGENVAAGQKASAVVFSSGSGEAGVAVGGGGGGGGGDGGGGGHRRPKPSFFLRSNCSNNNNNNDDNDHHRRHHQHHHHVVTNSIIETSECSSDEPAVNLTQRGDTARDFRGSSDNNNGGELLAGSRTFSIVTRSYTNPSLHRHRRTARMLFLCSVVFLVTWLPFWVDVFNHTHNLCLRYLLFVGNASNPIIYGLCNSNFRRSFVKLLVGLKPRRNPRSRQTRSGLPNDVL